MRVVWALRFSVSIHAAIFSLFMANQIVDVNEKGSRMAPFANFSNNQLGLSCDQVPTDQNPFHSTVGHQDDRVSNRRKGKRLGLVA